MKIEQLRKTEFRELAKTLGLETHTVILDGDEWFEQLTDGDVSYRYKVLSVERVSHDLLEKTALSEGCLPTRLKDQQSNTYALASLKPALWPVSIAIYFFRNDIYIVYFSGVIKIKCYDKS